MELSDAVELHSTEEFVDVFDSLATFVGKMNPFAEVTNSGSSSQRRILETPVSEVMPLTRTVASPSGQKYIVANVNVDYWQGEAIRHKYSTLPVTNVGAVGTIGATLEDLQPDLEVYAYPFFVRREIDDEEMSDYLSGYELYFANTKTFYRGDILTLGSDYYRLKTDTWIDGAGYSVAQAVKLELPVQNFDIDDRDGVYDPVNDTHGSTAILAVKCFIEPLNQDYEFVSPSFQSIEVGDVAISISKANATLNVDDRIGKYKVLSVRDFSDWATYQCRNAL